MGTGLCYAPPTCVVHPVPRGALGSKAHSYFLYGPDDMDFQFNLYVQLIIGFPLGGGGSVENDHYFLLARLNFVDGP